MEHFLNDLRQIIDTTAVAGFVSLILFFFSFFILIQKKSSRTVTKNNPRAPPEAAGKWPIIGHLHLLKGSEPPYVTLAKLADKQGPIFTVNIGVKRTLVISSWELAKECFTTHDLAVSDRPRLIGTDILSWNYANISFAPYGPYHREIRKIAASELLSIKSLERFRGVRESEVEAFLKDLYKVWKKRKSDVIGGSVEMAKWIGDLNLNVILRVVVGKSYFSSGENDGEEAARFRKVAGEFFRLLGLFLVGDAIPWLRWLDLGGHQKAMKRTQKELESIAEEWLEEHRRRRRESGGNSAGDRERDFMDVMMTAFESADLAGFDADYVNKAVSMNLIMGGTDTTTVTLVWTLCLVLSNPNVLKNLQDELDFHVGKERLVNESDISNLVYLQAVVKESLRVYPVAPLSGPREFTEDCTIGGYHVLKGTRLITSLWKIQTDPRVWPDPLEVKPEKFLTTHRDVDLKGKHFELIPFGAGRRFCPGINYGLQMTHLVLASLLQAFDVSGVGPVDMTAVFGLVNAKATPLDVLIKPRLRPSLYE